MVSLIGVTVALPYGSRNHARTVCVPAVEASVKVTLLA
jgi:hypothetical protein